MAEQGEQQRRITEPDTPVSGGRSQTGRAVALARLLHHECLRLLQLYKDRETFLSDLAPDDGRIVSPSPARDGPGAEPQVLLLHSALRQCLGLLHCVALKEEEEWGEPEGDYEAMRRTVRLRLEHLLHTTKDLAGAEDTTLEVTPDHQCNEETDGAGGVFALKRWTFRVLLELIHWADHAVQTLHVLHKERGGREEI